VEAVARWRTNSVLCFLVNKFGKVDVKSLKTALFDFCDVNTVIIECEVTVNEKSNQINSNLVLSDRHAFEKITII